MRCGGSSPSTCSGFQSVAGRLETHSSLAAVAHVGQSERALRGAPKDAGATPASRPGLRQWS